MTGIIAVIMIFSIPIIAIVTNHFQKQSKIKQEMMKDQIKLEKLKHENYLIETEKMRLQLEQMNQETRR
jgi:competence protein ComGC